MPTLGEQLKLFRIQKGMTQEQLANRLNTTKAAISRYEKGQRQPRLEQIVEMAMALDVSPDNLFNLILCSQESQGDRGKAMVAWVSTITGANGIIDSIVANHDQHSTDNSKSDPITYDPGDAFIGSSFGVHKEVLGNNGATKITISVEPEGMQLKDLIFLLDYLKKNNLAGEGITEMTDFMKAAYRSAKSNNE